MGTHARKIVKNFIEHQNLETDIDVLTSSIDIAKELVNRSMRCLA
jgi:hypothetical protein